MKAAIYSRKSKYTGKGESIENQIQLCKEYGMKYLEIEEKDFIIYEDEGFSGRNTKRPEFQRMMKDAKDKKFKTLLCYRLDRISRNVTDFSNLIKELNKYNVDFVSLREQFDTTTPIGRAMMYIASVFSQLERETIAERIKDNLLELAKTGRWLGGTPPTGYESKALTVIDSNGKARKMFKLSPIDEEIRLVKLIYNKYLELKSLTKVEEYMVTNRVNTKNGLDFKRYSLKLILSNPVYAIADKRMYEYLKDAGYEVYSCLEEFSGKYGLMGYNKTDQSKEENVNRIKAHEQWIMAVGKHNGIISSDDWIETQNLLQLNKSKAYRKVKSTISLLSGVLICGNCGSYMRPKAMKRYNSSGEKVFYYMCELKEKSNRTRCSMPNTNGNELDNLVIEELKRVISEFAPLIGELSTNKPLINNSIDSVKEELDMLNKKLSEIEISIMNLLSSIEKGQPSNVLSVLYGRIDELSKEKKNTLDKILEIKNSYGNSKLQRGDTDLLIEKLTSIRDSAWGLMNVEAKRNIIRKMVEKIFWDGKKIDIFLFGSIEHENC